MAKEQDLPLNPTKISGVCNRLLCCLTYEYETYKKLKANLPKLGINVQTTQGQGKVIRHNLNANRFVIRLSDNGHEVELNPEDLVKEHKESNG